MTSEQLSAPLFHGEDDVVTRLITASIDSTVQLFNSKCYLVKPTDKLQMGTGDKIPASELQLGEGDHYHFAKMELKSTPINQCELGSNIGRLLKLLATKVNSRSLIPAIAKCEAETWINLSMHRRSIENEAELRFAFAVQPILKLICSSWNLTVCGWGNMLLQLSYDIYL